jgi:virulence-associated protein VapD
MNRRAKPETATQVGLTHVDKTRLSGILGLPLPPTNHEQMYAMSFDLDTDMLHQLYPGESWRNAYGEVRRILAEEGFEWQQGSVYFGSSEKIDAVRCVLASQRLAHELNWFSEAVHDIRMLRIEENCDLTPAIHKRS